ncbi:MAG: hypothetical protein ACYC2O_05280 [Microthrixaceae bacterium]
MSPESPSAARSTTAELAEQLAEVGRVVRDVVRGGRRSDDAAVVRTEGGDDVFGVDARADEALIGELRRRCAATWPGLLVIEGFDEPLQIGAPGGEWVYLADPVDGTRGHLAQTHSAWVLLGAGRSARTLEDLEVGVAVEIPTDRAARGLVARADLDGHLRAEDDHVAVGDGTAPTLPPRDVTLAPLAGADLARRFVTVVRLLPGGHGPIGAWADDVLAGLEVYDDLYPCTGGQLMALATGAGAATLDPRPLLHPDGFHTHPYDLAALVVVRAAGVVVEALPAGPLDVPIDTHTPVAWAGYANEAVADELRARVLEHPPGAAPSTL